jgi:hypothetical protein
VTKFEFLKEWNSDRNAPCEEFSAKLADCRDVEHVTLETEPFNRTRRHTRRPGDTTMTKQEHTPGPQDKGYHVCQHGKNPTKCRDCKRAAAKAALAALQHGVNPAAARFLASLPAIAKVQS